MSNHTLEDVEIVSEDGESEEKDEAAYDELIDAVWKEHNPLFQRKVFGIDGRGRHIRRGSPQRG